MITTNEYIQGMECPNCQKKKLTVWFSSGGEGNSQLLLNCKHCNTTITTNLIPNKDDWIIHTDIKNKIMVKLWNQT